MTDLNVLIVEDDPMVRRLNVEYLARIDATHLVGHCSDVASATAVLQREAVDLVLLDVYLGRRSGLELVEWLRERDTAPEVILITAASEPETVRAARRLGVIDYLIKPFDFARFADAIATCRRRRAALDVLPGRVDQRALDQLFRPGRDHPIEGETLPKGLTGYTLAQIVTAILNTDDVEFSTETIAEASAISRVSTRKYLKFLVERELLAESFAYGQVGRPSFAYRCIDRDALTGLVTTAE